MKKYNTNLNFEIYKTTRQWMAEDRMTIDTKSGHFPDFQQWAEQNFVKNVSKVQYLNSAELTAKFAFEFGGRKKRRMIDITENILVKQLAQDLKGPRRVLI